MVWNRAQFPVIKDRRLEKWEILDTHIDDY